ncbi:MFS transporter [Spirillospora sp. NPDC047418]|jgi:MFS family permease
MQGFSRAQVTEGPLDEVPPDGLRKIWRWAVVIAVGGFLFGFDTGVISGALLFIRTDFTLNSFEQGTVVSVLVLGAMVGALLSGRMADRVGRRGLLLFSLAAMAVTMALLGLAFVAGWSSVPTLVFMVLFIASFAVGLGPVFWAIIGEIFPGPARATGSSASTAVNWGSNFAVSLLFLPIATAIGQGETFWILGAIALAGLVFVARFVPETKGRGFDEVDADLLRRFGRRPPESTPG